jgi:hypothetical protein
VKLRNDVLPEGLEISANEPKNVGCHDQDETENESPLERLLILVVMAGSWESCGIAMHRQPQHNRFSP